MGSKTHHSSQETIEEIRNLDKLFGVPSLKDTERNRCLIEEARQKEIDAGVPEERRTKVWYISCPCKKCSPFTL